MRVFLLATALVFPAVAVNYILPVDHLQGVRMSHYGLSIHVLAASSTAPYVMLDMRRETIYFDIPIAEHVDGVNNTGYRVRNPGCLVGTLPTLVLHSLSLSWRDSASPFIKH